MKLLLLDFVRRWWWMLLLSVLFSAALGCLGSPFIFAPLALICVVLDAQRGLFRVVRPLPISSRAQAAAWWFIAVLLVPLLSIPVLLASLLIYRATHAPGMFPTPYELIESHGKFEHLGLLMRAGISPWFATAVQAWVATGYAGVCFTLVLWLPTRPPEGAREMTLQGLFGALWGLSVPGLMFILPYLPRVPAAVEPWHWVVFAASPFCVLLSFLAARDVMQRRTVVVAAKARPPTVGTPVVHESGLTGVPLYITKFLFGFGIVLGAIAIGQMIFLRWAFGVLPGPANTALSTQFITIAIAFGAITGEVVGLRALRTLPLSTFHLALLLSCGPWMAGAAAAAFTALWSGMGHPGWPPLLNFAAQALAFGGWGALALAVTLHIASGARLFLLMAMATVPAALFAVLSPHSVGLALGGAISGTLGFALLHRGLRKSNTYYQPRRFFGVVAGQAMGVR